MARDNISDLSTFLAVARERNFTRAAAQLGMSQPAISQTIRELEARLGIRLLTRTTRSVAPTEAGERLLRTIGPHLDGGARPPAIRYSIVGAMTDARFASVNRLTAFERPLSSSCAVPAVALAPTVLRGIFDRFRRAAVRGRTVSCFDDSDRVLRCPQTCDWRTTVRQIRPTAP